MVNWKPSFNAIWVAELIAIAGFATTTPIIPLFLYDIGVSDTVALNFWTGLSHSGAALSMAIFAPIWGSLADSYGRKLMLLRAMFGGALLIGLMGLATEPWQIALLRTLQGSITGTVAAATVLTASLVPAAEAGYRLGLLQMAVYLGNSIGPLFGGLVGDTLGYRANFFATSALLAFAGLIVRVLVSEEFSPKPRAGSVLRNAIPDFSPLRRSPMLASLLAVVFAVQFATGVVAPMLPLFVKHLSGGVAGVGSISGMIIAAGSLAGALAAAVIGKVSSRLGYARTLFVCMLGAFAFYLPQGFVRAPWQLLALRLGSGIFLGGTMPSVNALIARWCDKDKQGASYGLSSSISSAGMALGPAVGSTVASAAGYPAVFFVTSAILGGIAAMIAGPARAEALGRAPSDDAVAANRAAAAGKEGA